MSHAALVTGCFGFIGSHLVELLIDRGYRVYGVGRPRPEKRQNFSSFIDSSEFELIEKDVRKLGSTYKLLDGIDAVFHLATARSSTDLRLLTDVNVIGTINILEVARRHDINRVVFSSSAAVYGNPSDSLITENTPMKPMNFYAVSKLAAEEYIKVYNRRYGLKSTILRYFNVYGPRKASNHGAISIFINQAIQDEPITLEGDGSYRYTPINVFDTVEATYLASQRQAAIGSSINICGSEILQISGIAQRILASIENCKSKIQYTETRPDWGNSHIGSTECMGDLLGYVPQITFENSLETIIEWYQKLTTI